MRLVDQSTRATIRAFTILAAVTALLLTMFTFAPITAHAVSMASWDTSASGPLPYTNFDDPDNDYGAHAPQAAVQVQVPEPGNTTCMDLDAATPHEVKFNVSGGSLTLEGDDNNGVLITSVYSGTVTDGDTIRDWTFVDFVSPDQPVTSVFVKQSTGGVWFNYGDATSSGDHHLHSQDEGGLDGDIDTISHVSFCFGEIIPPPAVAPTLTIVKQVINDDGGAAAAADFDIRINGGDAVAITSETADDGFDSQASWTGDVDPGEHTITEDTFPGYSLVSIDCGNESNMVTLAAGESATCTVINNDNPVAAVNPTVTLIKEVLIGDLDASAFPLLVTDGDGVTLTVASGEATALAAGTYTISETQQAGYELIDIECDNGVVLADGAETVTITVGLTESVECVITNAESAVLDEVVVQPIVEAPIVRVLPAVEQLPATGLDTMRLTLLSVLMAALGALFLLGTRMTPAKGRRRRG